MKAFSLKWTIFALLLIPVLTWVRPSYALELSAQFSENEVARLQQFVDQFEYLHRDEIFGKEFTFLLSEERPSQWLAKRVNYLIPDTMGNTNQLMTNYGAELYDKAKLTKKAIVLDVRDHYFEAQDIRVDSPRAGIIKVTPYFLDEDLFISENGQGVADSIIFSSLLFHEARHSDGHDEHVGFPHVLCPESSDYTGLLACDKSYNGPYGISAEFLKDSIKACNDCSEIDKEVLRLVYIDFQQRIINDNAMTLAKKEQLNNYLNLLDSLYEQKYYQDQGKLDADFSDILRLRTRIYLLKTKIEKLQDTTLRNNTFWDPAPEKLDL